MIDSVVDTLPRGRVFETVLEKVFADVTAFLEQQQQAQQIQQQQMQQMQQQAAQQPQQNPMLALEMQKNALKAKELEIKEKLEQQRIDLENRQLDAETAIKVPEAGHGGKRGARKVTYFNKQWTEEVVLPDGSTASCSRMSIVF